MELRHFDTAALPATPWKNGGGSTLEIVCRPAGADMEHFDWRISIATIAASGPFSTFAGVDRSITLLTGTGVRLQAPDAGIDHRLDTPGQPFAFPGDVPLQCQLLDGISTDFNTMVRRGKLRADVQVVQTRHDVPPARHGLLLAQRGSWMLHSSADKLFPCDAGCGVWWDGALRGWQAMSQTVDAALIVVRLEDLNL